MGENDKITLRDMIVGRMELLKENKSKSFRNLKKAKDLGGHSCYAVGYEEGLLEAYEDELLFWSQFL